MTWISVILGIISALPEIVGLIIKLIKIIGSIKDKRVRSQARRELKLAIKEAKRTKSSGPVEAVYKKYRDM